MEHNKMDQFLREKLDSSPDSFRNDWDSMSRRVSFMNFFKFGLHHFNVYYTLAAIVSMAGIMSAVFAFNFNQTYIADNSTGNSLKPLIKIKKENVANVSSESKPEPVIPSKKKEDYAFSHNYKPLERLANIDAEEVIINKTAINRYAGIGEEAPLLAMSGINAGMIEGYSKASIKESVKPALSMRKWFVEIYSQPVFSDAMMLSSDGNSLNFEDVKSKQSYGFMIGMKSWKWMFQTGLQFTLLSRNFSNNFIRNELVQVKSYEMVTRVVYGLESGKELHSVKDSVMVASEKSISTRMSFNHINSYKFLEIPLYLGYTIRYNKFGFAAKGGLIFDVYRNATGSVNTENQTLDLKNVRFYKSYFTVYSSMGLYYRLNPFMNFVFEPNLRFHVNGNSPEKDFIVEKKNFSAGIKLGIALDF